MIVLGILFAPAIKQSATPVGDVTIPAARTIVSPDGSAMGDPNAPITVVEFSDFQCPACKAFFDNVEETFVTEYVATGKVRFVYRSMGLWIGQESADAAEAAYCAGEQGKFWEYHNFLFANQTGENVGAFLEKRLVAFAQNVDGLDTGAFQDCVNSNKYVQQVNADGADGRQAGVQGTPTLFVYKTADNTLLAPIQGVPSVQDLRQILDTALQQVGQ
ncbi:MAG: hypothetical protein Fur0018_11170 [Anaerolineales bacterium]